MAKYLVNYIFYAHHTYLEKVYERILESSITVEYDSMSKENYDLVINEIYKTELEKGVDIRDRSNIIVRNIFKFDESVKNKNIYVQCKRVHTCDFADNCFHATQHKPLVLDGGRYCTESIMCTNVNRKCNCE